MFSLRRSACSSSSAAPIRQSFARPRHHSRKGIRREVGSWRRRGRLIGQLLAESFLLAAGGAILWYFYRLGRSQNSSAIMPGFTIASETVIEDERFRPILRDSGWSRTVFVFGLVPALQASAATSKIRARLRQSLSGTVGRAGLRNAVIVLEVALSLTLLFTAGLFLRSFRALQEVRLGFEMTMCSPDAFRSRASDTKLVPNSRPLPPLLARLKTVPGVGLWR